MNLIELIEQIRASRIDVLDIDEKLHNSATMKASHAKIQAEIKLQCNQTVCEDSTLTNQKQRDISLKNMLNSNESFTLATSEIERLATSDYELELQRKRLLIDIEYSNNLILVSDIQTRLTK